jgi:antirestriction protein ArdC
MNRKAAKDTPRFNPYQVVTDRVVASLKAGTGGCERITSI